MLTNGNKADCGFADEIVSYIYDESGEPERREFETHLAGCSVCTDEFAAISNARFSMFEWRREEFANLATPEIVIPYAAKQPVVADEYRPVGFLSGLRAFLSLVGRPMTVAAGLTVCIGLGLLAMNYIGGREQFVESNVPPVEPQIERVAASPEKTLTESEKHTEIVATTTTTTNSNARDTKAVKAVRGPRNQRPLTANNTRKIVNDLALQKQAQQARKAPVLSEMDETDDRSLRLADLFDGDGGR